MYNADLILCLEMIVTDADLFFTTAAASKGAPQVSEETSTLGNFVSVYQRPLYFFYSVVLID